VERAVWSLRGVVSARVWVEMNSTTTERLPTNHRGTVPGDQHSHRRRDGLHGRIEKVDAPSIVDMRRRYGLAPMETGMRPAASIKSEAELACEVGNEAQRGDSPRDGGVGGDSYNSLLDFVVDCYKMSMVVEE